MITEEPCFEEDTCVEENQSCFEEAGVVDKEVIVRDSVDSKTVKFLLLSFNELKKIPY